MVVAFKSVLYKNIVLNLRVSDISPPPEVTRNILESKVGVKLRPLTKPEQVRLRVKLLLLATFQVPLAQVPQFSTFIQSPTLTVGVALTVVIEIIFV